MYNLSVIKEHAQIKELGSSLKYNILKELITNAATCQQLANIFNISKQKVHYSLTNLLDCGLIEIADELINNNKEIYYRAIAKNFVLDFSLGDNVAEGIINSREILNNIITNEFHLNLNSIASKILDGCLRMKPRETLLLVSGKYNLPLVEKILIEASRRMIFVNLIYHDMDFLKAKNDEYSLAAYDAEFEYFNKQLSSCDVYLNLNGESRYVKLDDSTKQKLRIKHFTKSHHIINTKGIRVAMMPGLLHDTLSHNSIMSELQFWKALDVDYDLQSKETVELCQTLTDIQNISIENNSTSFHFTIGKVVCESGSFTDSPFQSPVINLPGGEILIFPHEESMSGTICSDVAYAFGEEIIKPTIEIKNNEIISFKAETNENLITRAIDDGGIDGRKVAMICLGTNSNIRLETIDVSYRQKSKGLVTVYWGENKSLGGNVEGHCEWFVQLDNPTIKFQ